MPKCPHYGCLIDYVYPEKGAFLIGSRSPAKEINITNHYFCHLKKKCVIKTQPYDVLSSNPGTNWTEMDETNRCCGFACSYSLKLPEIPPGLLKRKIKNIEKSGAEIVVVVCPGCLPWSGAAWKRQSQTSRCFILLFYWPN